MNLTLFQTLLQLYTLDLLKGVDELWYHTTVGRELVNRVRRPHDPLPPNSPIHLAIDPYIARRLPNFMPIRVTEVPPLAQIWDSLDVHLEVWAEVGHLVTSPSLLKWTVSFISYAYMCLVRAILTCSGRRVSPVRPPQEARIRVS